MGYGCQPKNQRINWFHANNSNFIRMWDIICKEINPQELRDYRGLYWDANNWNISDPEISSNIAQYIAKSIKNTNLLRLFEKIDYLPKWQKKWLFKLLIDFAEFCSKSNGFTIR